MKHLRNINEMSKGRKGVICVDLDGVIHGYSKGYQDGSIYDEPVPGAKESLQKMKDMGHRVYVFSARTDVRAIEEYMDKHNLYYDKVHTGSKPPEAEIFIDDRAINFSGDWADTMSKVENFEIWTKKK